MSVKVNGWCVSINKNKELVLRQNIVDRYKRKVLNFDNLPEHITDKIDEIVQRLYEADAYRNRQYNKRRPFVDDRLPYFTRLAEAIVKEL